MSEATELTVFDEEQALAEYLASQDLTIAGQENLEREDLGLPPRLRISSQNRPILIGEAEAAPGMIVNTLTGTMYDRLEIVLLAFLPRTRVLFPAIFATDNKPLCASDDGKLPAENRAGRELEDRRAGPCAECPDGQFGAAEDGGRLAPRCKLQRTFLVYVRESEEPALLTLQSTGIPEARKLTTLAKSQGLAKSIVFATRRETDPRGTWYIPVFAAGTKLNLNELRRVVELRTALKDLTKGIGADISADMAENGKPTETLDEELAREREQVGYDDPAGYDDDEVPF